ncbi:hypothetical protein [Streptomyces sp. NPDC088794]|uniref:hypothetical protein n=1 Tax=Streptomyces sp. NPDC088794 TaxID=3365902 RepID=UPI00382AFED3
MGELHTVALNRGDPVSLGGVDVRLQFEASIKFTVVEQDKDKFGQAVGSSGRYKVSTRGYMYTVMMRDGAELIAYHWHPGGSSDVDFPHEHIGTAALSPNVPLTRRDHLRTGRMSFESVVFNLFQIGITPLNWNYPKILEMNQVAFDKWKTWG